MWSLECNKSFWQEPSQVRNEVNTHRGGKKQGRSRKRAWSHCLTLILKPPNVWVSICHSQRDLDFLLFAATCTLMEAGVAVTQKNDCRQRQARGWVRGAGFSTHFCHVPLCQSISSLKRGFAFPRVVAARNEGGGALCRRLYKVRRFFFPTGSCHQTRRGKNMVHEQANSCFLKGFNIPRFHWA